jgi:hypothetical protein
MTCSYLVSFPLSPGGQSLHSCTANDRTYVPSLLELQQLCRDSGHQGCPVLMCNIART